MSKSFIAEGLALFEGHQDDEKLPSIMVEYATAKYVKLNTRASALSKLKRVILDTHYKGKTIPQHVAAIQLTRDEYMSVNSDQAAALKRKTQDCIEIKDCDEWAMRILSGINSDQPAELFTAVALCCGRRTIEILSTGSFEPTKNKYEAMFSGAAKRRDDENQPYPIPLLLPYSSFIVGFNKWRELISSNHKLLHGSTLGRFTKSVTGMDLSPHAMRSIYAMICYHKYGPQKQSMAGYISQILGHQSVNVSVHYSAVKLAGCSREPYRIALTADDFKADTRGERTAIERIINMIKEGKKISVNELRRAGTSYLVAKRVLDMNKEVLDSL